MRTARRTWLALAAVTALGLAGCPSSSAESRAPLLFFWGVGCPHCADGEVYVERLEKELPRLRVERWEVWRDPNGRRRFAEEVRRLQIPNPGVPTFICKDRYYVGFTKGQSERPVRELARACGS
jgi:hypothetical protein